jgi:MFS transporter, MHS family, alpha-ketoglutarate permease
MQNLSNKKKSNTLARYIALGGGVAVEWYDWSIYGLMSAFLGPHFFPSADPVLSTLSALAVFALGFVVRPISGAILGPVTDRIGHKKVLIWSIGGMALCSLGIGIMPSYEQIGVTAGILIIILRLIQGISTGIEQPAANAAALELARPGRKGFFSGVVNGAFNQSGNLLSALVAFLTSMALGKEVMADWGWRVPFIIGALLGLIVMFTRKHLPETGASVSTNRKLESTGKVWGQIWKHKLGVVAIIFVTGGTMIANYIWITGLPNLANSTFKENSTAVFGVTTALMVLMVLAGPLVGYLADRFGSSKVYLTLRILQIPTYFLVLVYAQPGIGNFAVVMLGGGIILALNQTLFNYITATLMPQEIRTTGIAIGYGIAVTIFGGTASYLLVATQRAGQMSLFLWYGAIVCTLSVFIYIWAMRRGHVVDANQTNQHEIKGNSIVS